MVGNEEEQDFCSGEGRGIALEHTWLSTGVEQEGLCAYRGGHKGIGIGKVE